MAASTTSVYLNQIDANFPLPGQNNSSQGFRSNFSLIKQALSSADSDISGLKLNAVNLSNATNDFNYNIIKNAVLHNTVDFGLDNSLGSAYTGDFTVKYTDGQYQRFLLGGNGGQTQTITVDSWPNPGITNEMVRAKLILCLTASAQSVNDISFTFSFPGGSYINLGPQSLPQTIAAGTGAVNPRIFEISYDGTTYFVQQLSVYPGEVGTGTTTGTGFTVGANTYITGINNSTVVKHGNQFATLAQIPSTVVTNISHYQAFSTTTFQVSSIAGISPGATFSLPNVNSIFTVYSVDTIAGTVTATVPYVWPQVTLQFVNPRFTTATTVLTLNTTTPGSTLGYATDLAGQVYADATQMYVTFDNFTDTGTNNKIYISADATPNSRNLGTSTAYTQHFGDNSTRVATTEFVQTAIQYTVTATTVTNALNIVNTFSNGYGARTISPSAPTNGIGSSGDIWYQI